MDSPGCSGIFIFELYDIREKIGLGPVIKSYRITMRLSKKMTSKSRSLVSLSAILIGRDAEQHLREQRGYNPRGYGQ